MRKILTLQTSIKVQIPSVPNFIRVLMDKPESQTVPLTYFSEAELEIIGKQWIDSLIENRKRQASTENTDAS